MLPRGILFILSDQHRFDCLGTNGHPLVQTPNLDRLASEGVNFRNAFCPAPVCVPCRTSLMCGQWPAEHGAVANFDTEAPRPFRDGLPLWSQVLHDAGFWQGWVGKWHVHPLRDPTAFGFDVYISDREYGAWRAAQGLAPPKTDNGWCGGVDHAATPAQSRLSWAANRVIALLHTAAKQREPFLLRWDTPEPHLPNIVPEPYAGMYRPEVIAPWPSFGDPLVGKPYIQAQQRRTWGVEGWTWDQWAPIVARYLGEISLLDAQVGRVLDALDFLGLTQDTIVIYSSDHGDLCGGHGMVDKHYVMYDDVVRVPFIVRWPAVLAAGQQCGAFVSHAVDLAVTLCHLAAVPVPPTFRGQNLVPLLLDPQQNNRQDIFASYHGNQFGLFSQRMVRDHRWKYVWNATAEDELYDLQMDPGEIHNRACDPSCESELARLRHRLVAWMEQTHDPLLNGWTRRQLLEGLTR